MPDWDNTDTLPLLFLADGTWVEPRLHSSPPVEPKDQRE